MSFSATGVLDVANWARCADQLNQLRYIRETFLALHKREPSEQEQQCLMDIVTHLEAAMEVMFRHSVKRETST
jgi:hypothetical protein